MFITVIMSGATMRFNCYVIFSRFGSERQSRFIVVVVVVVVPGSIYFGQFARISMHALCTVAYDATFVECSTFLAQFGSFPY